MKKILAVMALAIVFLAFTSDYLNASANDVIGEGYVYMPGVAATETLRTFLDLDGNVARDGISRFARSSFIALPNGHRVEVLANVHGWLRVRLVRGTELFGWAEESYVWYRFINIDGQPPNPHPMFTAEPHPECIRALQAQPVQPVQPPREPVIHSSPDADGVYIGDIVWFSEARWRVLDIQDNRMLLLSEVVISFGSNALPLDFFHSARVNVTWETSEIRRYLNDEFYNWISPESRARIAETYVINNDNPTWGTCGGNNTVDRIFLLSVEEVLRYFGDRGWLDERLHQISDGYNRNRIAGLSNQPLSWWLRTPGLHQDRAVYVFENGSIGLQGRPVHGRYLRTILPPGTVLGYGGEVRVYSDTGIRPAMWIYLD